MAKRERLICASNELKDDGGSVSFPVPFWGKDAIGFAVRFEGVVHAYLNRCAHMPLNLDWQEGKFFDTSRQYLICSSHGALYEPTTGYCVLGPCEGKTLQKLKTVERDGNIYLEELEITS